MAEQTKKAMETDNPAQSNNPNAGIKSKQNFETADRSPSTGTGGFPRAASTTDISDTSNGLLQKFRSTAGDAYDSATSKATEKLEEQKSNLSSGLSTIAGNIRNLGDNLSGAGSEDKIARITSDFSNAAAQKIERAAQYFDRHDINEMYRDVENVARRNPALFLGGAFALGFLAARFLKSASPRFDTAAAGRAFNSTQGRRQPQLDRGGSLGL